MKMKLFISICIVVLINVTSTHGAAFNFGNLLGNSKPSLGMQRSNQHPSTPEVPAGNNLPEVEDRSDEEDSQETDESSRTELDAYMYNSSLEEEFMTSIDSWNSTEDNTGSVQSNASNNASDKTSISVEDSAELKNKDSNSNESIQTNMPDESSTLDGKSTANTESTPARVSQDSGEVSSANITRNEQEEVIRGTDETSTTPVPKSFLEKSIEWAEDEYTLSILIPITAGVVFALTIIITVAICRCVRRCCRRRRFKKHALPDSVKTLRPSDRARLLGDFNSSDDEF